MRLTYRAVVANPSIAIDLSIFGTFPVDPEKKKKKITKFLHVRDRYISMSVLLFHQDPDSPSPLLLRICLVCVCVCVVRLVVWSFAGRFGRPITEPHACWDRTPPPPLPQQSCPHATNLATATNPPSTIKPELCFCVNARGLTDPLRPCGPPLRRTQGPDVHLPKILDVRRGDANPTQRHWL